MEKKKFIVAAANMDCRLGDVKYNLNHMKEICEEAAGKGTLAIVFPELATTSKRKTILGENY